MTYLEDFFASSNEEILGFLAYQTVYFFTFYGTFRPIWSQNEITSLKVDVDRDESKISKLRLNVTRYGWQTRKRNEWRSEHYSRWVLLNPEYFYNGILWMLLFLAGGYGSYYVFIGETESDIRTATHVLSMTQLFVMGLWTIPGFYWDLPGWSIIILACSTMISLTVSVLIGVMGQWTAFTFYTFYAMGQAILTIIYGLAYTGNFDKGISKFTHPFRNRTSGPRFRRELDQARKAGGHHKHPLGLIRSFWKYGLYPASYLDRDIPWIIEGTYDSNPPLEEKKTTS